MSHTAIKSEEEKTEYFDDDETLTAKIEKLAVLIENSKNFVTFTGAGLSVGAGIPDYRSAANTVNATGAGCWEKKANIEKARKDGKIQHEPTKTAFSKTIAQAQPVKGHMSLVALMQKGYLKHIISQNLDGLHRKSGIPENQITELHGNVNLEICEKCDKTYIRDFAVKTATKGHKTGRKCDDLKCKGDLRDSMVNFGEHLNQGISTEGFQKSTEADLMLCLGSSMRVEPANEMAQIPSYNGGKVVIVNLQATPMDDAAELVIHCLLEDFFERLMDRLFIPIPKFQLQRWVQLRLCQCKSKKEHLVIEGITDLGNPFEMFRSVEINNFFKGQSYTLNDEQVKNQNTKFDIKLQFQGHYNEQDVTLKIDKSLIVLNGGTIQINLNYDPNIQNTHITAQGEWSEPKVYRDLKTLIGTVEYKQTEYIANFFQKQMGNQGRKPQQISPNRVRTPRKTSNNRKPGIPPVVPKAVPAPKPKTAAAKSLNINSKGASQTNNVKAAFEKAAGSAESRNSSAGSNNSSNNKPGGFLKRGDGAGAGKKIVPVVQELKLMDGKLIKTKSEKKSFKEKVEEEEEEAPVVDLDDPYARILAEMDANALAIAKAQANLAKLNMMPTHSQLQMGLAQTNIAMAAYEALSSKVINKSAVQMAVALKKTMPKPVPQLDVIAEDDY